MEKNSIFKFVIANALAFALIQNAAAQSAAAQATDKPVSGKPTQTEMWEIIQKQQKQIDELSKQLGKTSEKTDAVAEVVDSQAKSEKTESNESPGWWQNTQLGGYGELHYNGGEKDQIDFHRFVLMVNHQFNESIRLFTELEVEHALVGDGEDKPGEVEVEQAYLEFDINDQHRAKAGLFLIPVGLLNERHEPTRFFGVERNPVEVNIIPTTWWEAGVSASGELVSNFKYDLALHSGLNVPTDGDNAFKIRNGRQKVAEATAKDAAVSGRLLWNGISGVELGVSAQYQNDITQSSFEDEINALLLSPHVDIRKGALGLRALYANWNLDGDAPEAIGRDEQDGWYVEPAYYFDTSKGEIGVFARYNTYDNNSGDSADSEFEQIDAGVNYWPHKNVGLKADMAFVNAPTGKKDDEILNLGIGFNY